MAFIGLTVTLALHALAPSQAGGSNDIAFPCDFGNGRMIFPEDTESGMPRDVWLVAETTTADQSCGSPQFFVSASGSFGVGGTQSNWPGGAAFIPNQLLDPDEAYEVALGSRNFRFSTGTSTAATITQTPTVTITQIAFNPDHELPAGTRLYRFQVEVKVPEPRATSVAHFRLEPPDAFIDDVSRALNTIAIPRPGDTAESEFWAFDSAAGELCVVAHIRDFAGRFGPSARACATPDSVTGIDPPFPLPDPIEPDEGGCQSASGTSSGTFLALAFVILIARRRQRA